MASITFLSSPRVASASAEGVFQLTQAELPDDLQSPRPGSAAADACARLPTSTAVFVGRDRELRLLEAALDGSLAGRGRVVMLAGEPGIGKTETARQLAAHASRRGAVVLRGGCYEGGWQPAFGPWAEALSEGARLLPPERLRQLIGPGTSPLLHLLPAAHSVVEGPLRQLSPDEERFRLYSAVTDLLRRMCQDTPVVLLLDDLHWADRDSLDLVRQVGRAVVHLPLLVIGTYRDVGLDRGHPLMDILGALRRETDYEHLHLRGFSDQEVADYLDRAAGQQVPIALAQAIHAETAGNPLYVRELFRHLLEEDTRLLRAGQAPAALSVGELGSPEGVRHVLSRRLTRLSEATNNVLRIAAAFTGAFELGVLRDLVDLPEARLVDCLDEAEHAGLIRSATGPGETYEFAHAIVRHTIYDELTAARKVRLHRAIAEVLERRWRDPQAHLAELAHHFVRAAPAGDAQKAVEYTRRAAEHAVSHLAYDEGRRLYEMALQALDLTQSSGDDTPRCELLLGLGDAETRSGAIAPARNTFQLAADAARRLRSPALLARAALGLGAQVEAHFSDARLVALLEEALGALGEQDSPLRVRLLGCLAMALYFSTTADRRASLSGQALEMARRLGDRAALAYALSARHFALWGPADVEDRLASATELLRLAQASDDLDLAMQAHAWRIMDLLELGEAPAAFAEIETHTALAHELQQPLYLWRSSAWQATRALMQGRFEEGERLGRQALSIGEALSPLAVAWFGMQMFTARWNQGRLQDLAEVTSIAERYPAIPAWRVVIVICHLERGNEAQARAELDAIAADDFRGLPRDANWLIALALLSEVAALLGDTARAATLYELLLPYAARCVVVRFASACWGSAARYLGVLAATSGRWTEAAQHFEQALAMNTRLGAWPLVAHTEYEYGRMLLARGGRGDVRRGQDVLDQASARAREFGMARLAEQVVAARRVSRAALGQRTVAGRPAALDLELARLTQREREVVRLVAGGLTNRAIADALVIAPGTAALHVEHIRNKLGFRSRAQVAAWAAEHGLRGELQTATNQD